MGTKARPFYRMVVANSTEPRGGKFVEILGTYNPVVRPAHMSIKEDRALHWLIQGAQPSETAAIVLSKIGVLDKYFEQRPKARASYKFLDKRTASMSVKSVMEAPAAPAPKAESAPAAVEEAPIVEAAVAEEATPVEASEAPEEATANPEEATEPAADSANDVPAEVESAPEPEAAEEKPE
jgi:small subunit ribosomal protein S16